MALCALSLVACSAATQTKQGAPGEVCNGGDTDCRPGLLCQNSVCTLPDSVTSQACQRSCDKISSCGVSDLNCMGECAETVASWSESVIDEFADCLSNDLSCDEIGASANDAAQVCYDRLEVDQTRLDRCRDFKTALNNCNPNRSTTRFESACIRMARTTNDEDWGQTGACIDAATCQEGTSCIDRVFGLN